ncbi:MAG: sulfatase-like hydrolase/transferase, partial [Anaerolineae bacterium]|nr:sulfatase-like hydrolase/transferase [Gemmatimonadaceae bacterium]
ELRSAGYVTAAFMANWGYVTREHGLGRGFIHFEDHTWQKQLVGSSVLLEGLVLNEKFKGFLGYQDRIGRKRAPDMNAGVLNWLSDTPERPFFVFMNYMDAHIPYLPPQPFDRKFVEASQPTPRWTGLYGGKPRTPAEVRVLKDLYESSIAYLDHHLGLLFEELERRGFLQNTIIVITSDHGETLGEHGDFLGHAASLYMTELHVPLLISFPSRLAPNTTVRDAVTLRDLPATIMDLVGLDATALPGHSLAGYSPSQGPTRPSESLLFSTSIPMEGWTRKEFPVSKGGMTSMIKGGLHYIRRGDQVEELYGLDGDELEQINLANRAENNRELLALRASVDSVLLRQPGRRAAELRQTGSTPAAVQ